MVERVNMAKRGRSGAGAHVLIPIGVRVTVDSLVATRIGTIRVDGTLAFATNANSELRVDTVIVAGSGLFEMGTAQTPIQAGVRARLLITDNGPIDRSLGPVRHQPRTHQPWGGFNLRAQVSSFHAINGAVRTGATTLNLATVPTGWKVGDSIVIAATVADPTQNETRTIKALSGSTVTLDAPLSYDHLTLDSVSGLQVHVANLTRNAVIESETTVIERRGHVMFMHTRDVNVYYGGFYKLGRTNKLIPINDPKVDANWQLVPGTGTNPRARYAVHFHRTGSVDDGHPSMVVGSAVVDSPGWGYVNHSSYVNMIDNVAYDVDGAAFTTEVGDEIGSFVHNIAIGSSGSGELTESRLAISDFGHQGDGFWFQGAGITVTDNVAAGNTGHAFIYFTRGLHDGGITRYFLSSNLTDPSIAGGSPNIDISFVPIKQFTRNVGYASGVGLSVEYNLRDAPIRS